MTKIMKIKHNTKRKKYIKKKKNDKTIKRRKHYSKKIYGGAPMSVNQRQNLITKYKLDLDKLINKFKNNMSSVNTEKEFYNAIDSNKTSVDEIVDKYICILLMNDIATDAPNEKVVEEINKYVKETIIDLSKLRSKVPNLPPSYPLIQSKDIIPFFIKKYLSRMDIIFKYIKGHILSIDDNLDALLFIFRTIYSSPITDETKSKMYHMIFEMYKDKIKNYTDEVYTTNSSEKQRVHKMVTLMMNLATLESNFDLIKFIVFNNVDIQDYLINKHKSVKDFILSYGNIRYIKMTRKIPIYNYWNSLVEKRTGMNVFEFKRKLIDYVKSSDICKVLREKLPGFSPIDNSVILDEFPYCYGFLLISIISYLLQEKCSILLTGGKSIQLALYDYYLSHLDLDLTNKDMRNIIVNFIYDKYLEQYNILKSLGKQIDTSFYFVNTKNSNYNESDPTYIKNAPMIKGKIGFILEYNKEIYKNFINNVKNIIARYTSYDIDTRVVLNDVGKLTPQEVNIKSQVIARNMSLFIEWLSEENGYLKFKYHRSSFSPTYKIGYLSDNKIRERLPSETTRSEESKHIYYNNETEYQTLDTIDGMSEESKQQYEGTLNSKGEKAFDAKYYTEIIDVGYSTNKVTDKSSIQNINIQFGDFNGVLEYQNLKEIVKDKLYDIHVVYKDTTKHNELYYKEKAINQVNMFAEFKYDIVNEMIDMMKKA
jgi:uncharacterized coiled-coil protein SlyX